MSGVEMREEEHARTMLLLVSNPRATIRVELSQLALLNTHFRVLHARDLFLVRFARGIGDTVHNGHERSNQEWDEDEDVPIALDGFFSTAIVGRRSSRLLPRT